MNQCSCSGRRRCWCNLISVLVALVLLVLLLRACHAPQPVAVEAQLPVAITSHVSADGHITLVGEVATLAEKTALLDSATALYGAAHVTDQLSVDERVHAATFNASDLLAWQKNNAIEKLDVNGNTIAVAGSVDGEEIKTAAGSSLQTLLGANYQVDNQLALKMASGPDCSELNQMQVLFHVGSTELSDESKVSLQNYASCFSHTAFEVGGHTDNTGIEANNLTLSEQRAGAVVSYLESQGVSVGQLTAKGYGQSQPVASNDTPEGRDQNRRIVFAAK